PAIQVLHRDEEFMVLHKPADVRMDGEFNVSMEKLIKHWLPGINFCMYFASQASITKVKPSAFRLDYATSGVLLIALTKKACSKGSDCFASRAAGKEYLAVVEGHV
ncbi:unnamed protein product, partial [Chrysoparadoxa australica]